MEGNAGEIDGQQHKEGGQYVYQLSPVSEGK